MSRVKGRTVRRHRHNFSRDLVLHGIRKSSFRKYWNFNVLEMALKTFHFVSGLSRTPLLSIPRSLTNIFYRRYCLGKIKTENQKSGNLKLIDLFLPTPPPPLPPPLLGPAAAIVLPWPVAWHGNIFSEIMINSK